MAKEKKFPIPEKIFLPLVSASRQGNQVHTLEKSARPKKYLSPAVSIQVPCPVQVLNVGFHQRRKLADFLIEMILVDHDPVDDFFHGAWLVGRKGRRCGNVAPSARYEHQDSYC